MTTHLLSCNIQETRISIKSKVVALLAASWLCVLAPRPLDRCASVVERLCLLVRTGPLGSVRLGSARGSRSLAAVCVWSEHLCPLLCLKSAQLWAQKSILSYAEVTNHTHSNAPSTPCQGHTHTHALCTGNTWVECWRQVFIMDDVTGTWALQGNDNPEDTLNIVSVLN